MLRRVLIVPSASISLLTPTDTLLKLSMLCDMAQDQRCKLSNASQASTLPAQPPPPKRFHLAEARHMITLVQVLPRLDHGCSRSIPLALEIAGAFGAIIEVLQILVELLDCPAGGEIVGIGVQAMLISPLVVALVVRPSFWVTQMMVARRRRRRTTRTTRTTTTTTRFGSLTAGSEALRLPIMYLTNDLGCLMASLAEPDRGDGIDSSQRNRKEVEGTGASPDILPRRRCCPSRSFAFVKEALWVRAGCRIISSVRTTTAT